MSEQTQNDDLLNTSEATKYIRRSRVFLWRKAKDGEIAYIRAGRRLLWRKRDLEAWLDRNTVNAQAAASER